MATFSADGRLFSTGAAHESCDIYRRLEMIPWRPLASRRLANRLATEDSNAGIGKWAVFGHRQLSFGTQFSMKDLNALVSLSSWPAGISCHGLVHCSLQIMKPTDDVQVESQDDATCLFRSESSRLPAPEELIPQIGQGFATFQPTLKPVRLASAPVNELLVRLDTSTQSDLIQVRNRPRHGRSTPWSSKDTFQYKSRANRKPRQRPALSTGLLETIQHLLSPQFLLTTFVAETWLFLDWCIPLAYSYKPRQCG